MLSDLANLFVSENPDACVVISTEGEVLLWNKGAETIFGFTEAEALHQTFFNLILRPAEADKMRGQLAGQGLAIVEWLAYRKDRSPVYVDFSAKRIERDGQVVVTVTAKDVTLLKVARDAKLMEAKYRGLLESMPDAIVLANETGRIVLINKQAELLFGYQREELVGQAIERLIPERYRTRHVKHRSDYSSEPRTRPMGAGLELFGVRKDRSEVPVEISLSPLQSEEGMLIVTAIRDITERKVQNRRIEEANRLKSEFLASMSHELRTPLNGIIGFTEFLVDEKPGPLNERQREYLQDVLDSGRHLLQLINDVLDLSKIEAGKLEIIAERFSFPKLMREVCAALEPVAEKKGVQMIQSVEEGLGEVFLDPGKLKQILYNLVSNAVKFTDAGGSVTIAAKVGEARTLEVSVKDTGIGIRKEDFSRLFVEFAQLNSGERRQMGTGLGLALTKKLLEAQNGRISFESEFGKGSTFTVQLPLEAKP